jgi:hypothetical protein
MTPTGREIPWLRLIQFHKEVVRRAEESFFALPGSRLDSDRWTILRSVGLQDTAGPWTVPVRFLVSDPFRQALMFGEPETVFIGGPRWVRFRRAYGGGSNWVPEWLPLIYREVRVMTDDGGDLMLVPEQGAWEFTPLLYQALDRMQIALTQPLEDLLPALLEDVKLRFEQDGEPINAAFRRALLSRIPELEQELGRAYDLPGGPENDGDWVLFTPPGNISPIYRHLITDYEGIEERLQADPGDRGGLSLLEGSPWDQGDDTFEVLPIVPLNDSQHEAVQGILLGRPVTVISGPPGTGKSQVVVSTLLNAWAIGRSVLFTSNNNQAVDVVRERIAEFEDEFPIAIRAGSRKASNLEESLHRTLNVISVGRTGTTAGTDLTSQKATFLGELQELQHFLESGLPQRVDEAWRSALGAHGQYHEARERLQRAERGVADSLHRLGYNLPAPQFLEEVLRPFRSWAAELRDAHADTANAEQERSRLLVEKTRAEAQREEHARSIGLDVSNVGDWSWLSSREGPEEVRQWYYALENTLRRPLEEDLRPSPWDERFSRWRGSEDAAQWEVQARQLALDIRVAHEHLSQIEPVLQWSREDLEAAKMRLNSLSIPETVKPTRAILEKWAVEYAGECSLPTTRMDWVPWSSRSKVIRRLRAAERSLRPFFPPSIWRKVGKLDAKGRERLAEVVETTMVWLEAREAWEHLRTDREEFNQTLSSLRTRGMDLDMRPPAEAEELEVWRGFSATVQGQAALAGHATEAWDKRERAERTRMVLRKATGTFRSVSTGHPFKDIWAGGSGEPLCTALRRLEENPNPSTVQHAREALLPTPITPLLRAWASAKESQTRIVEFEEKLATIPTKAAIAKGWWRQKPASILTQNADHTTLPTEEDPLLLHLAACEEWEDSWQAFRDDEKPELERRIQSELQWATGRLWSAVDELPESSETTELRTIVENATNDLTSDWLIEEMEEGFRGFNPDGIRAKIQAIEERLKSISFNEAKRRWVEVLSRDLELQGDLDRLLRRYRTNQGRVGFEDYGLFQRVLKALPVWVTTALSPQALPLIPGLFDVVVIDEATQCTATDLLPLVYRAKRLVVIGDPEQLPAIPSMTIGAERALASSFGVPEWMDLLGHAENNVYSTAVHCLPRRHSDVIGLTDHYRSHPLIIGFSNQHVYHRRLRLRRALDEGATPMRLTGLHGQNIPGRAERGDRGRSWRNRAEAEAVLSVVANLRNSPETSHLSIGVVTPFRAHVELIEELAEGLDIPRGISVGTAHRFQGDERDVMILSPVVAPGISESAARWVETPRNLINVAVTRARDALFFLGHYDACRAQIGILRSLVGYVEDVTRLREVSHEELELFSWMVMQGWSPEVHPIITDIEVDFVLRSPGRKLVVEVDGPQHEKRTAEDQARDAMLRARGYDVFRTPARAVRETPSQVIQGISQALFGETI